MSVVIDASATLAWIYPDETTAPIQFVFEKVIEEDAWVPALWRIEIGNSLLWGIKRGRTTHARRDLALADLTSLPIFEDDETGLHAWEGSLALADKHRLTLCDATYLELALRLSLPLATLDEDLRKAAQNEAVELLGK